MPWSVNIVLLSTLILTKLDLVASAIDKAAIPSFRSTLIPTFISLSIDRFSTTVVKLASVLFEISSLTNGVSPKFSIIIPSTPPKIRLFTSSCARSIISSSDIRLEGDPGRLCRWTTP